MKICNDTESTNPKLIRGHLYTHDDVDIYLCTYANRLVSLTTGNSWCKDDGYGAACPWLEWKDVTDQYCLQKIKQE